MKKNLLFLLIFTLCACTQNEDIITDNVSNNIPIEESNNPYYVTIDEAQDKLEDILANLNNNPSTRSISHTISSITNRFTTGNKSRVNENGDDVSVHVFNFGDNDGFAIMSADNRTTPLLALTTKGKLEPYMKDNGSNLVGLLANIELVYKDDMKWRNFIQEDPMKPIFIREKKELNYFPNPNGMCEVKWGQGMPYNKECKTADGRQALTGCVATAVAQLMSIYEYPTNYEGATYDWKKMKNVGWYSTNTYGVDKLMSQLGKPENLNMSYGTESSSANPANIPRTLEHFGYNCGGQLKEYKTGEIVYELMEGHPVLIGGHAYVHNTSVSVLGITIYSDTWYSEGHRWLGHGLLRIDYIKEYGYTSNQEIYKTEEDSYYYILCNLGWDGFCDGFYYSGHFDTNEGPKYQVKRRESLQNGESSQNTNGTSGNYQYNLNVVSGIRQ